MQVEDFLQFKKIPLSMILTLTPLQALVVLTQIKGLSPRNLWRLLDHEPCPKRLLDFLYKQPLNSIKDQSVFIKNLPSEKVIEQQLELLDRQIALNIEPIDYTSGWYPFNLEKMADPPPVIYAQGTKIKRSTPLLGIVGTRKLSSYGRRQIDQFFEYVKGADFEVVSGLAHGTDSYAQAAAIDAGVRVHSVLAHGLDKTYPKEQLTLRHQIESNGLSYSEYTLGTPAYRGQFLARNRLIAGMCDVLWIVESAQTGGSLVTAEFAKGYGTPIFASPGPIDAETSQGCNRLIADQGAAVYQHPESLATCLGIQIHSKIPRERGAQLTNPTEIKIYELLRHYERLFPSQIIRLSGLEKSEVLTALIKLQLDKVIVQFYDNAYGLN